MIDDHKKVDNYFSPIIFNSIAMKLLKTKENLPAIYFCSLTRLDFRRITKPDPGSGGV